MKIHLFLVALLVYGVTGFSQTKFYEYTLKEVKQGIFVTVRQEPLRQVVEGNFVIIVNDSDVVVVDAAGSPRAARIAIKDIKKITKKPVSHLINTHFHGDHTFGNQEYLKQFRGLEIVSSKPTAEVMFKRAQSFSVFLLKDSFFNKRRADMDTIINKLSMEDAVLNKKVIENHKRYRDFDLFTLRDVYREVKITPPTLTFDREFTLHRGQREIRILFLGAGDTPGDTWVFLPAEKVLITGDAVVHPVPYGFTQPPRDWLKTLEKAAALDFDILIPGHGDVQYSKNYLLQLTELLKTIIQQVDDLSKQNLSKDAIKSRIDISQIESKFTNNDPFLAYYFNEYFKAPLIETLLK
jgi:glyoxylase-like metal-dependent hydrolase (beta-lactamase superfamily II)